jgi:hypothetical protein
VQETRCKGLDTLDVIEDTRLKRKTLSLMILNSLSPLFLIDNNKKLFSCYKQISWYCPLLKLYKFTYFMFLPAAVGFTFYFMLFCFGLFLFCYVFFCRSSAKKTIEIEPWTKFCQLE